MKKVSQIIADFPLVTFLIMLAIMFGVIFIGNQKRTPGADESEESAGQRAVEVYSLDSTISAPVLAEVERADTITLVATTNGIVSRTLSEGAFVYHGGEIVRLADTYGGSSQAGAAAALAARNVEYQKDVYDLNKSILDKQKDQINKTDSDEAKIARKQVSLQKRASEFGLDSAKLEAARANAVAAVYSTVAPFTGTVQEVSVRVGDSVSAGQRIGVLKADAGATKAPSQLVAYVGADRAAHVNVIAKALAQVDGRTVELDIVHIAKAPSRGGAYAVTMTIPSEEVENFADGSFVEVELPLDASENFIIPLDTVRYGSNGAEVYVIEEGLAVVKSLTLGDVIGSFVIVKEGLAPEAQIITDRTVSEGESLQISTL